MGKNDRQWGYRLKQARLAAGLSQKQLGILAGIDEFVASTRINRYEQGVHQPDFRIAQNLAKALDVSAAYLYATEDDVAEMIYLFGKAKGSTKTAVRRMLKNADESIPR